MLKKKGSNNTYDTILRYRCGRMHTLGRLAVIKKK
jgi:hypothetical protein